MLMPDFYFTYIFVTGLILTRRNYHFPLVPIEYVRG